MNKKFLGIMVSVFILFFATLAFDVYARDCAKEKGYKKDLEEKFSYKAHFILKNKDDLGLSDEQVKRIKDLKTKMQKNLIRGNAELDILALDIKSALWSDKIDINAVNKLIDKKYDLKKEKSKSLVNAYATLKGILTGEQKEKMKDLFKKSKKEMMHGSMMKGEKGHAMMKGKMQHHMMGH